MKAQAVHLMRSRTLTFCGRYVRPAMITTTEDSMDRPVSCGLCLRAKASRDRYEARAIASAR